MEFKQRKTKQNKTKKNKQTNKQKRTTNRTEEIKKKSNNYGSANGSRRPNN